MVSTVVTHQEMMKELKKHAHGGRHYHYNDSYTGSAHTIYGVPVPIRRQIVKDWLRENKDASAREVLAVVDALISGESHEEKTMGAMLLGYRDDARTAASFKQIDAWLGKLVGWAEIDAFCQSNYSADELLENWSAWEKFLIKLSKDKNINKRRSSIVFLTWPTTKSDDKRLHALAYKLMDDLKHEKDILITKAISWLLRSMAIMKPKEVSAYLNKNTDSLPKIAIRETRKKILTGKKN